MSPFDGFAMGRVEMAGTEIGVKKAYTPRVMLAPGLATAPDRPRLLDRVRNAVRARHYSIRTEEAYVGWIRRFILFHGKRHPNEMGEPEINAFLSHLATAERGSEVLGRARNRARGEFRPARARAW